MNFETGNLFKPLFLFFINLYTTLQLSYNIYVKEYVVYLSKLYCFYYYYSDYYEIIKNGEVVSKYYTYNDLLLNKNYISNLDVIILTFYDYESNKINKVIINIKDIENDTLVNYERIKPMLMTIELEDLDNNSTNFIIDLEEPFNYYFKDVQPFTFGFLQYYLLEKYKHTLSNNYNINIITNDMDIIQLKKDNSFVFQ